ncbi:MAG: hypothetical protein HPY76_05535, partial [Anaerolineae bacterium]|nr:hypothetical protein [Anaerolineae bacterium]
WTTNGTCGDSQQDVNHFNVGDDVYINGSNFVPNGLYVWSIQGNPGGSSADPDLYVMGGIYKVGSNGTFCFKAYTVLPDDRGEYTVDFGKAKNDNYRVKDAEEDGVSLSYKCAEDGSGIEWYVTNDTNKSLRILWNVDNNASYPNSKDVAKKSTVLLTTTGLGEHTVYLKWDADYHPSVAMGDYKLAKPLMCDWHYLQLTSDKMACYQLQNIALSHDCTDDGQIEWTVDNPNAFAIKVDWTLKDAGSATIASGSGTDVPAGSELVLHTTGLGVYTLTVAIVQPFQSIYHNLTSDEDTCYVPDPLTLSQACELDQAGKPTGRIVWTVTNPNDREFSFTLQGSAPPTPVAPLGSAPANGSVQFLSIDGSYNTFARFIYQSANYDSNSVTTVAGDCEAPPVPLTLSFACELDQAGKYTGFAIWTVYNPNDKALSFTVNGVSTVEAQPIAIGALGNAYFTTDDNVGASVTVSFVYKSETYTSDPETLTAWQCTEPQDIYITQSCYENGNGIGDVVLASNMIHWWVVNPNPYPVDVEIILDGGSLGTFTIAGNSSQHVTSDQGAHTLEAKWGDGKSVSESTEIDTCVPPLDLQMLSDCPAGGVGTIHWSVTNPNLVPVDFVYFLDQDPPVVPDGGGTIGAGETLEFALTSGGAHYVSIAWLYGGEGLVSTGTAPDYCLPPGGGGDGGDPLPPPGAAVGGAGGPVLIPVTGADRSGVLQSWLINLGLVFLGAAFVLTAVRRRKTA